ncbi:MAG: hypothetical protein ABIH27_02175 [Candidatus Omnitrophota bacterium]
MKKYWVILGLTLTSLILISSVLAQEIAWEDKSCGLSDYRAVLIRPDKPDIIYAGSGQGVLNSVDSGNSWREMLSVSGGNKKVNYLLFSPKDMNCIYAATGAGLFYSSDEGKRWSRIYKGKDYLESDCTSLAVLPYGIYLGTRAGLLFTKDNGRSWQKVSGKLGQGQIYAIAYSLKEPDNIYVACIDGVYKTKDAGKYWENVFQGTSLDDNQAEDAEEKEESEDFFSIRYTSIDPNNLNYVYIATSGGVYKSSNRGENWGLVSSAGLLSRDIIFIKVSDKSRIYAASKSGVYLLSGERWEELSLRLSADEFRFLVLDNQDHLYVASNKGLFRSKPTENSLGRLDIIKTLRPKEEPGINEVQQAAIKYAEVGIEKIKDWRKRAAKKAWLPKASVSINRDVSDLYHWEGGSTTKVDDDILRKGRDSLEWDISLSWDLGELIWNQDQTSIDVRSKLMVQLRDGVLDEVTKLYFERLRVKMELDNVSIEDQKKRFEKELRLQELTAMLNGMTGGYFLQEVEHRHSSGALAIQ